MKFAVVTPIIEENILTNLEKIKHFTLMASANNADFIIFPEAVLTGLINNDNPEHDFQLALEKDSIEIQKLQQIALKGNIALAFGYFEKDNQKLFDSFMCINSAGTIIANYRRITPGWHNNQADKSIYLQGNDICTFSINNYSFSSLICGDLFDENLMDKIKKTTSDYLLVPFARAIEMKSNYYDFWKNEEFPFYIDQCKKSGKNTILTNYISRVDEDKYQYIGGSYLLSKDGKILYSQELLTEGILYFTHDA